MFRRTAAIFAICPWQTEPVATSRDPSEPICLLERLGNEPFWDNVPIVRSPLSGLGEAASATSCRPKNSTLLPAKLELLVEELHWPSLRQYLQPLTYLSYADAVQNQDRLSWKFPSWRAEGPLHETMTLSDGFNSFWHSLQEVLREDSCSTAPCLAALLLGEIMQLAREVLARPLHRHSLDDLWHVLRQPLPWKSWLHSSWALPLLESLLTLLKALPSLADVDLVMRAQMQEILKDLLAATDCKVAAEDFLMSNFQSLWQNDAAYLRPVLRLVADCLTPPAQSSPFFLSERRLSHALCENTVQSMNMGEDIVAHLHGASAFIQVDHMGRSWLRLEFLHFVSTTDGTVRLMVYGNRKQDRMYYAQALTLPRGLVKKWRCSLDGVTEDARLASFFGYDAVAYCDLPLVPGSERKELQPSLSMGSAYTNNFRLCLPQKKRWRLAACTQPLHSFAKMEQLAPTLLKDFLDYHQLLGIEHFTIFDADGSLSGPLERYRAGDERKVEIEYVDHWPERLGAAHATGGSDWRPLLFEVEAENYCLWRYRGQADWAVVLHSPDEFLHVVGMERPRALHRFLDPLEAQRPSISHVELRQILFGGEVEDATSLPGRFRYREEGSEAIMAVAHTAIVNVENVAQAGVHPARPRPSLPSEPALRIIHADPMNDIRINHYVNALGQQRCGAKLCKVLDESALWAEEMLKNGNSK